MAKKDFLIKFLIAFAATALIILFFIFAVFRGLFCNIYITKGNKNYDAGKFEAAITDYMTAKKWKGKNQEVYLCLAKAYSAKGDFDTAGNLIDEAIEKKITTKDTGPLQLYLMRIKVYTAAGKLSEALNYIGNLDDQYILKKIQAERPEDISYSPTQGSYDRMLKMKINVRDGETVYYTTDGTTPTKFSNTYTAPINIGNGSTVITAVAIDEEGLISPLLSVSYEVTNENEAVSFDDEKMEKMVRNSLSKPRGVILVKELAAVTHLSGDGVDGYVRTLSDLDLMPNLESLTLYGEKYLTSISQLSGKTKLKELSLAGCDLDSEDINVLGSLTALEFVDLSDNNLTSVDPLSELTEIRSIILDNNKISSLDALSSSVNIEYISAASNSITAIPDFDSAEKLTTLILNANRISDISTIHRLTALTYLDMGSNSLKNGGNISSLTNLEGLVLVDNSITNFDFLKNLTKLTTLDIQRTGLLSLAPLEGLPLTVLDLNGTEITNLLGIEKFGNLTYLAIANTEITDISPVKGLEKLDYLDISNLEIKDPSPLFEMKELCTLIAEGFNFHGIAFANPDIQIIS